jgi:hypothetical protein
MYPFMKYVAFMAYLFIVYWHPSRVAVIQSVKQKLASTGLHMFETYIHNLFNCQLFFELLGLFLEAGVKLFPAVGADSMAECDL